MSDKIIDEILGKTPKLEDQIEFITTLDNLSQDNTNTHLIEDPRRINRVFAERWLIYL